MILLKSEPTHRLSSKVKLEVNALTLCHVDVIVPDCREKAAGKLQAMALAMKVGVPSSAFFCPTVFQSLQCESRSREPVRCGPSLAARPYPQLVCQLDNDQSPTITTFDVSRR